MIQVASCEKPIMSSMDPCWIPIQIQKYLRKQLRSDPDQDPYSLLFSIKNKQFVCMINNSNNMVYHVLSVSDNSPTPSPPLSPPPSPPPPLTPPLFPKMIQHILQSFVCVLPCAARSKTNFCRIFARFLQQLCEHTNNWHVWVCAEIIYPPSHHAPPLTSFLK